MGCSEDFVAGFGGGTILFPATAILADGDDCGAAAIKDRGVTTAGVEGIHGEIRLKAPKARNSALTSEQIGAIIAAADAAGDKSMALGHSLQWWLTHRAAYVRGQWLSDGKSGHRWPDGQTWDMFSKDLTTLTKVPSMTEEALPQARVFDLIPLVDVRRRLAEIPQDKRIGPVIVQKNGVSYLQRRWQTLFRRYADAAGIPKDVWNMDTGAVAITRAKDLGATKIELQHQANHATADTTERYIHGRDVWVNRVIKLRAGN